MGQYDVSYGPKYDKSLSRVEIAKRVRADLKAAVKAGELPKAKYSVRTEQYSGGGSINVRVSDVEGLTFLYNPRRLRAEVENPNAYVNEPWMSDEASALIKKVDAILQAYNYDGSDIQSDYFHVRFYGHAEYDWKWQSTRREQEIALLAKQIAPANDTVQCGTCGDSGMHCNYHASSDCECAQDCVDCWEKRRAARVAEPVKSEQESFVAFLGGES